MNFSLAPLLKTLIFVLRMNFVYDLTVYMHSIANCAINHYISCSVGTVYKNHFESFIYSCLETDDGKHLLLEE